MHKGFERICVSRLSEETIAQQEEELAEYERIRKQKEDEVEADRLKRRAKRLRKKELKEEARKQQKVSMQSCQQYYPLICSD